MNGLVRCGSIFGDNLAIEDRGDMFNEPIDNRALDLELLARPPFNRGFEGTWLRQRPSIFGQRFRQVSLIDSNHSLLHIRSCVFHHG